MSDDNDKISSENKPTSRKFFKPITKTDHVIYGVFWVSFWLTGITMWPSIVIFYFIFTGRLPYLLGWYYLISPIIFDLCSLYLGVLGLIRDEFFHPWLVLPSGVIYLIFCFMMPGFALWFRIFLFLLLALYSFMCQIGIKATVAKRIGKGEIVDMWMQNLLPFWRRPLK